MRVLTWNLFHGRAVQPRRRDLFDDFAEAIDGWDWDVALLQEVLPWWPARLGAVTGASARSVRTSRNWIPPLRWLGRPMPDLVKSWSGGCNAILVRGEAIAEHRTQRLRRRPERRAMHAVRLANGIWAANLHAQVRPELFARSDTARAAVTALAWAGDAPLVLGGDFNLRDPAAAGLRHAGGTWVDHVLVRGFEPTGPRELPDRGDLSDHKPVVVELTPC
jgi:endonuclease/exonuclease/phosphatase family metal-dependent hydrolase